ncbi:MAG: hypothetical protein NXI21_02750 [Alphaproteobacteria bacterium]|nr:hypothetical protein [Alphaproteobacteria bacterium]
MMTDGPEAHAADAAAPMTEARFERLTAAYGADPARWPASERAAAAAFVQADREAAAPLLAEAAALDQALATARAAAPTLSPRTLAAMRRGARPGWLGRLRRLLDWPDALWQPAGAVAAALLVGFVVGLGAPPATPFGEAAQPTQAETAEAALRADFTLFLYGPAAADGQETVR